MPDPGAPARLTDRTPVPARDRLVADLAPPPRFAGARFDTYRPDPAEPTQAAALDAVRAFAAATAPAGRGPGRGPGRRWWSRRDRPDPGPPGLYLDGGFGVGKTHLLAAAWHAAPGPKAYATFVELTHLVGALGFAAACDALGGLRLLCVDEFELDDPGDTVLVSSLLARLTERGVRLAATSNTLPDRLGEGRFAADDFRREVQGLAAAFATVRIDGPDYRHRDAAATPVPLAPDVVRDAVSARPGATLDSWPDLLAHLARLHPSRYGAVLDDVPALGLLDVAPVPDQAVALRVVVLADRLYDRDLPVLAAGTPLDGLFAPDMLAGGYRKKYLRATSRLVALARPRD